MASLVRPEFGPPLPALLRRRAGVREPVTLGAVALLVVVLGFAMVVVRPGSEPGEQLVHRSAPVFNLLYEPELLAPVEARPGELIRLQGRRGGESAAVTVRPLELPEYRGDVAHGLLPTFAAGHIERLRAALEGFRLQGEGRARVNDAPGYEVSFRARPRLRGSDVLLVPPEGEPGRPVILSLRRTTRRGGARTDAGRALSYRSKQAFRSFRYGTDRG